MNPGDGAFYAPKIDLHMTDSIGRSWQMGTIQLDGWMPQRLDATYTTSEDELERPFMIHRALFGSFERFIGILIEHFAGAFPLWLAPVQVAVLPLSDASCATTPTRSSRALRAAGLRAELDARDEKVGRKIHDAEVQKVPVDARARRARGRGRSVSVRRRGGVDAGVKPLDEVVAELAAEARERRLAPRASESRRPRARPPAPPRPPAHRGAHGAHERPHAARSIHLMRTSCPRVCSAT